MLDSFSLFPRLDPPPTRNFESPDLRDEANDDPADESVVEADVSVGFSENPGRREELRLGGGDWKVVECAEEADCIRFRLGAVIPKLDEEDSSRFELDELAVPPRTRSEDKRLGVDEDALLGMLVSFTERERPNEFHGVGTGGCLSPEALLKGDVWVT